MSTRGPQQHTPEAWAKWLALYVKVWSPSTHYDAINFSFRTLNIEAEVSFEIMVIIY
jgi:hypothetical protein